MEDLRDNIPVPRAVPWLGNIHTLRGENSIEAITDIARVGGDIFKLKFFGIERIVCASAAMLEELCDEKRFWKGPSDALSLLSNLQKTKPRFGLFAAPTEDEMDWQIAHRILVPAFGPLAIEKMFPEMYDIATQLVMKWARMPDQRFAATEDFTRLTLDTIALTSMDYRFNSFYSDELHPFLKAMNTLLTFTNEAIAPKNAYQRLNPWNTGAQRASDAQGFMLELGRGLAAERRKNPTDKPDLLNAMVNGIDPKTGQGMDDSLTAVNINTFLVAGHETTSGLLSFTWYYLLKNPTTYFKAQQEVDRVVGREKLRPEHLKDFKYLNACLREAIRLYPTAPGFVRSIRSDGPNEWEALQEGSYAINKRDQVIVLLRECQTDPKVYGEDAREYNPDRMLDENFEKLPQGAFKPFGTGVRACIGRAFAWQEALMVMAVVLQNFNVTLDSEAYTLKVKQTLTIKPAEFYVRATLREGLEATTLQAVLNGSSDEVATAKQKMEGAAASAANGAGKPMTILYGSNTGTCQSLSERLSTEARKHGYHATVRDLDAGVGKLPKDEPVVIITASYEGQPPDNATAFIAWLESLGDDQSLAGVKYAVFGCGHSDWQSTFQRIPNLVDTIIFKHGGERIVDRGLCNAAQGTIFSSFDSWSDGSLWPALSDGTGLVKAAGPSLDCEVSTHNRGTFLRQDVQKATVVDEHVLTTAGEPVKRHLEVKLPQGMKYETGDYLAILPLNPEENIRRVMRRFNIQAESSITIKRGAATFLPVAKQLSVHDLLSLYVELSSPVTQKDIGACIDAAEASDKATLQGLLDNFATTSEQKTSLLDVLERFPTLPLTFPSFLAMLPPLRPRHYSISSSPLVDASRCTITYAIIDEASKSGNGRFIGVTGAYMADLRKGDEVLVSVRSTNKFFHLPANVEGVPIMMFCGGSGIAPFRGFLEERAVQISAGRKLAPALLFVGCRSSTKDRLYGKDIDAWQKAGVVDVRYAFSREPKASQGCKYVQDRMLKDKEDILHYWRQGAKVFTCGGTTLSAQVSQMAKTILREVMQDRDEKMEISEEEAEEWFRKRRNERFVVDVFA